MLETQDSRIPRDTPKIFEVKSIPMRNYENIFGLRHMHRNPQCVPNFGWSTYNPNIDGATALRIRWTEFRNCELVDVDVPHVHCLQPLQLS